ncbi:hypothetical protein [Bradyrhizobium sp. sGM-13]|uniref:hypothetical protein n=1 Tax=Bradyrhizobium sp. sGM-13 TaxID=2831781 RepID=UPI001BCD7415|nr:hypothetical protein [Bradyrhizobium sp. sGM-13]
MAITAIASRTGDGRGATSRPNGDADDDASEGDATAAWAAVQAVVPVAVQPVIQAAACLGLEPRA